MATNNMEIQKKFNKNVNSLSLNTIVSSAILLCGVCGVNATGTETNE